MIKISDLYDEIDGKWIQVTENKILQELPEIIKNESDEVMDKTTSYLHSNIEKNEEITENKIHRSESLLNSPKYNLYSAHPKRYKNKDMRNHFNDGRYCPLSFYDFYISSQKYIFFL